MIQSSLAWAQAGAGGDNSAGLISLVPFLLIFVVFYFLLILPQQRRQKKTARNAGCDQKRGKDCDHRWYLGHDNQSR